MNGNAPMFNYPDTVWNHGEAIVRAGGVWVPDQGGWHGLDDGLGVTADDVHFYDYAANAPWQGGGSPPAGWPVMGWQQHTWFSLIHPGGQTPRTMWRVVGFIRPTNPTIPPTPPQLPMHPEFNTGLNFNVRWVDSAAFELFAPDVPRQPGEPVVLVVGVFGTLPFPAGYGRRQTYLGYNSPDGLARHLPGTPPNPGDFWQNVRSDTVLWREYSDALIGVWKSMNPRPNFYPICGYIVPTAQGRPTELIHQRCMQLLEAMKLIVQDPNRRPPDLGQLTDPVTVVFQGGSNGGQQSAWAALWSAMMHQTRIHGVCSRIIAPNIQRLYGEQEAALCSTMFSGFHGSGAALAPGEGRNWMQFVWNRDLEVRDLSLARHYAMNNFKRPVSVFLGDEDATGTGTDTIRLMSGGSAWSASGINGPFSWTVADKRDHGGGQAKNPYTNADTWHEWEVVLDLIPDAIARRNDVVPADRVPHLGPPVSFDRDIDDPNEWAWARREKSPTGTTSPLTEDTTGFFATAQPGHAGTWLGHKESVRVHESKVYVGGAEGVLSCFEVDQGDPRQPMKIVARAQPLLGGSPPQQANVGDPLGHNAFGMVRLPDGHLVVGTRRYLHKLAPLSGTQMQEVATAPLSWRRARPHRLRLIQVSGNPMIVVASMHGGILVFDQNLSLQLEYEEPGVVDLEVTGTSYQGSPAVSILSERGVLANVTLGIGGGPTLLHRAARPEEDAYIDLERATIAGGPALVTVSDGGQEKLSLRAYVADSLAPIWRKANLRPVPLPGQARSQSIDLAAVHYDDPSQETPGDHLLLLDQDHLYLFDNNGNLIARKRLDSYLPAVGATAIAVGELVPSPPGPYQEEVVIPTQSGHLVWFHISEIAASGDLLPSAVQLTPLSAVQPRTNQALSCTWAIAADAVAGKLEVLDQSGMHWQVTPQGNASLVSGSILASGPTRGWTKAAPPQGVSPSLLQVSFNTLSPGTGFLTTRPRIPQHPELIAFQFQPPPSQPHPNNWPNQAIHTAGFLDGFKLFRSGGDVVLTAGGYEAHWWSGLGSLFGDMLEGMQVQGQLVTEVWATTGDQPTVQGNNFPFLDIRNVRANLGYMDLQALRAFQHNGQTWLVLGCPGGRVRIVKPGAWTGTNQIGSEEATSPDFGHGGAALAVRPAPDVPGTFDIFFGVLNHHASGTGYGSGALTDSQVLTGAVYWLRWAAGPGNQISVHATRELPPVSSAPNPDRGGFGVLGVAIGNLLGPGEEDELVVTTLAGDLFVLGLQSSAQFSTGQPLYRTWVPGGLGHYNSIVIADLDATAEGPELYVAGSLGIRKWKWSGGAP